MSYYQQKLVLTANRARAPGAWSAADQSICVSTAEPQEKYHPCWMDWGGIRSGGIGVYSAQVPSGIYEARLGYAESHICRTKNIPECREQVGIPFSDVMPPCGAGDLLGHTQHLISQRPYCYPLLEDSLSNSCRFFSVAEQISHPGGVLVQPT